MKSTGRKAVPAWTQRQAFSRDETLIAELVKEPTMQDCIGLLENAIEGEYDSHALQGDDYSLSAGALLRIRRMRAAIKFIQSGT